MLVLWLCEYKYPSPWLGFVSHCIPLLIPPSNGQGAYRLCAQCCHSCTVLKLWEDDKKFVKTFTATTFLFFLFGPLLVRSSSCSVLVLARLADFKNSMNFWTLYVGLGFGRKLPYVSFWEAVPRNTVHISCTWMPQRASFLNHCSKNDGMSGIWTNQLRTSSKLLRYLSEFIIQLVVAAYCILLK
jgi:hypothetical protein